MKITKENLLTIPKTPGIYLFTNLVNGKHYVGQALDLRKRLQHHINNFEHNRYSAPLYKALEKYGLENFDLDVIKILTKVKDKFIPKVLDHLEVYFIDYYHSYGATGYNQTRGGDGGILGYKMTDKQKQHISQNSKAVACDGRYFVYGINIKTGEIYSDVNMTELANKLNLNPGAVRTAKSKHKLYKGKYYFANTLEELQNPPEKNKNDHINGVSETYLIDYYNYLQTLDNPTIEQVAENLGLVRDTINKRNKKLKEMGYKLPFTSYKINYIELIDIINNTITKTSVKELSEKFSISEHSVRKQIKRTNIYKKQYKFNIVYY